MAESNSLPRLLHEANGDPTPEALQALACALRVAGYGPDKMENKARKVASGYFPGISADSWIWCIDLHLLGLLRASVRVYSPGGRFYIFGIEIDPVETIDPSMACQFRMYETGFNDRRGTKHVRYWDEPEIPDALNEFLLAWVAWVDGNIRLEDKECCVDLLRYALGMDMRAAFWQVGRLDRECLHLVISDEPIEDIGETH